ncbi:hypothetical protein [Caulobacter segnis]|uniref:hypothetical protein n=1 Tax=Caulobacter segnis TaxID=88688 RepID=UPI001CC0ABF4|nr:hypothetical protein [Caulobacter segnis]UAL11285.1 hypothetical protein K8940_03015 [Caulobacter segnis]
MSLLIAALIGLLAVLVSRNPGGWLWRVLVEAPARKLSAMTGRQMLITAIVLVMAIGASELVLMDLAWVLAADIVAWIELFASVLIFTRLLPGWRAFKGRAGRTLPVMLRGRPRASRARRARRPAAKPSDDPDSAGAFLGGPAFA